MRNTHQLHIEQLTFKGVKELREAIYTFTRLRDAFSKLGAESDVFISTKIDGAPAIIFGKHPESGKFFVSTKSFFNKTPKIAYSINQIERFFEDGPVDQLKYAFEYMNHDIKGIYQGDLLFTPEIKSYSVIDGEKNIIFRPNTITYAVPVDSEIGKQIVKAKIGIAVHTQYVGEDINNLMMNSKGIDIKQFQNDNVFAMTPEIKDVSVIQLTQEDLNEINSLLSTVGTKFRTVPGEIFSSIHDLKLDELLEQYINTYIRKGELVVKNPIVFRETFNNWASMKKLTKKQQSAVDFLNENAKHIATLLEIYAILSDLKIIFLKHFNHIQQSLKTFIFDGDHLNLTKPEGYSVIASGDYIKFVDRLEFSKNNFNLVKNW